MTVGKNPHRPEGKANADNERMQASWMNSGPPHDASRNQKQQGERAREYAVRGGLDPEDTLPDQVGGSRPGVPSRVKEAIARQQADDGDEDEA